MKVLKHENRDGAARHGPAAAMRLRLDATGDENRRRERAAGRQSANMRAWRVCCGSIQRFQSVFPSPLSGSFSKLYHCSPILRPSLIKSISTPIKHGAGSVPLARVSTMAPSFANILSNIGSRLISTSRPCRSIDEIFISQPKLDKDGKVIYPSVGETEIFKRHLKRLRVVFRSSLDCS